MPLAKLKLSNEEHHCMLFYVLCSRYCIIQYSSASNKANALFPEVLVLSSLTEYFK